MKITEVHRAHRAQMLADLAAMTAPQWRVMQAKVVINADGCWEWPAVDRHGYGRVGLNRRRYKAHRLFWTIFRGPLLDDELQLDHLCRNRSCCNPDHLEPVSEWENLRRMRVAAGMYEACPQGHPREPEDYVTGVLRCRKCRRARDNANRRDYRRQEPPAHGTWNAYSNYKCRCDECKAAGAARWKLHGRKKAVDA